MLHEEKHFQSSEQVRDFVIGMSDGLTVPFALAAGLSGAAQEVSVIVTAGIAEIAAGSIAMGLGGYLAGRTEVEHYQSELKREYEEVEHKYEVEINEVKHVVAHYGLSEEMQEKFARELAKDKDKWVDFMMRFELGLEKPNKNRALQSAWIIGGSYILGGIIPLLPYFFSSSVHEGFTNSVIITLICLFIFGLIKSKLTGRSLWKGTLHVVIIGTLAAAAAFLIARLIS